MPSEKQMKCVRRDSIRDDFEMSSDLPVPPVTPGGARIKVYFAGATYTDCQVIKSGQRRPRMHGVLDTSLFPGIEVSGIVDDINATDIHCNIHPDDRVIVYPTTEEDSDVGYSEYMSVKDASNLIRVPDTLSMDVAAMLPCGGLMAYAAVLRAKPFVQEKLHNTTGVVNVLIVGAGGLGLWTLRLAEHFIGSDNSRVHLAVADTSIEKLVVATKHGCANVIHWDDALHEEYIQMRTRNVCKGGVDAVIDFVSSARTIGRATRVLKEGGIIIVGGNSKFEVPICLYSLALKSQSIVGVHRGTREQLTQLVDLVAARKINPPMYSVFPVEEANKVFQQLSQSKLDGRAVLRVWSHPISDDSVFFHANGSQEVLMSLSAPAGFRNPDPMSCSTASPDSATGGNGVRFFAPQYSVDDSTLSPMSSSIDSSNINEVAQQG